MALTPAAATLHPVGGAADAAIGVCGFGSVAWVGVPGLWFGSVVWVCVVWVCGLGRWHGSVALVCCRACGLGMLFALFGVALPTFTGPTSVQFTR